MTSCTSVLLPDPLTPVTAVSSPSGISTSMSFRLCSLAPSTFSFWFVGLRRTAGTGIASSSRRYLAVSDRGSCSSASSVPRKHDPPALLAGTQPHVDDRVGDADHVSVVLDDEDGVALIAKLPQDRDQPLVVARVEADRRLVEHVERVDERGPERRRQVDALRFAARERRRQPIERQVVEPDVAQEPQPLADLLHHLVGDGRVLLRQRQVGEEPVRVAHRERADLIDRLPADLHVARLATQPGAEHSGHVR